MFSTNVGTTDRIIRGIVGIIGLVLFFMNQGTTLGWIALVVGVVMLFTAIVRWCPPYAILGINTCKIKS